MGMKTTTLTALVTETSESTGEGAEYDRIMAGTSRRYVLAEDGSIVRRDAQEFEVLS